MTNRPSFLFIPDITGFTAFVNTTEIEHGQHIISELLEGIINADELDLQVSEVEGDAVLFYKYQDVPSLERLVAQSERMFIDFHERIKKLESRRICQCGACSSAINLSIKMVAHVGEIGFTQVRNVRKPYGAEVVEIHTLLKNKVDEKEYVLLSNQLEEYYKESTKEQGKTAIQLNAVSSDSGGPAYSYFSLAPLFDRVKEPQKPIPPERLSNPHKTSIYIDQKKELIYELLINFDMRKLWNRDAKEINYEKGLINHVGAEHQCVLKDNTVVEFESFTDDFGENILVYGERILKFKLAKSVSVFFILEDEYKGTRLTLELHIQPLPIIGRLLKAMMIYKMSKGLAQQLSHIKEVGEQRAKLVATRSEEASLQHP